MKSGNVHASSSSLNVSYHRAAVPPKSYICDRCERSVVVPGLDGTVRNMPCDLSCGHLCCWACTEPNIRSPSSRCPACGKVADVRFERALYRALTGRAALAKSLSMETLGSETVCSCDGCHRDTRLPCIEECRRDADSDSESESDSDDTDWSSDEDGALGEVTDDEDDGGALCETRQLPSPGGAKGQQPSVNVFDFLDFEDPLIYQEKPEYSSRSLSRERRSRPTMYETKRYSVPPNMMAATTPLIYEGWRNNSLHSPSSTQCQVSPVSSEFRYRQRRTDSHEEKAQEEKPRRRRPRRHTLYDDHDRTESSYSADIHIGIPLHTQYSEWFPNASDNIRPLLRKHHSDSPVGIGRKSPSCHGHHSRHSIPPQYIDEDDLKKQKKHHRNSQSFGSVVSVFSISSGGSRHSSNGKHKGDKARDILVFCAGGKPGHKLRK
ncbi:hypothetical protein PG996_001476 [Apiospora saccharicola]|uniref:RING-type domain-containing protein n=1 Tax=Apiospora saccharicola TaxID=335842 RepID=A0ABR1WGS7_9PEZI